MSSNFGRLLLRGFVLTAMLMLFNPVFLSAESKKASVASCQTGLSSMAKLLRNPFLTPLSDEKLGARAFFELPPEIRLKMLRAYIKSVRPPVQNSRQKREKLDLLKILDPKAGSDIRGPSPIREEDVPQVYGPNRSPRDILIREVFNYLHHHEVLIHRNLLANSVQVLRPRILWVLGILTTLGITAGVYPLVYPILSSRSAGTSASVAELAWSDARRDAFRARAALAGRPIPQLSETWSGLDASSQKKLLGELERLATTYNLDINQTLGMFEQYGRDEWKSNIGHLASLILLIESTSSEEVRGFALKNLWLFYLLHPDLFSSGFGQLVDLEDFVGEFLESKDPTLEHRDHVLRHQENLFRK